MSTLSAVLLYCLTHKEGDDVCLSCSAQSETGNARQISGCCTRGFDLLRTRRAGLRAFRRASRTTAIRTSFSSTRSIETKPPSKPIGQLRITHVGAPSLRSFWPSPLTPAAAPRYFPRTTSRVSCRCGCDPRGRLMRAAYPAKAVRFDCWFLAGCRGALGPVQSGRLRALAVTSAQRVAVLPVRPDDAGIRCAELRGEFLVRTSWRPRVTGGDTRQDQRRRHTALRALEVGKRMQDVAMSPSPTTRQDFDHFCTRRSHSLGARYQGSGRSAAVTVPGFPRSVAHHPPGSAARRRPRRQLPRARACE